MSAPGVGPKPSGPTHPTPTAPPRPAGPKSGHLPPDPRCDCGHGDLDERFHLAPCPHARPVRPRRLGALVSTVECQLHLALATLERDYDLASAPSAEDDPTGLGYVEIRLLSARADVSSALRMLEQITSAGLPPAGSAVQYPARRVASVPSSASLPGGPTDHLAAPSVAASGGLTPGLAPTQGGSDATPPGRNAGFTLPVTERFVMPGTDEIAAGINEALARRSR
jgi:hypothetical protein